MGKKALRKSENWGPLIEMGNVKMPLFSFLLIVVGAISGAVAITYWCLSDPANPLIKVPVQMTVAAWPTYTPYPTLTPRPTYTPYPSPAATQNIAEPKGEKTITPTPVLYRVRKSTFVYEGPGLQNDTIGRLKENARVSPITGPIKIDGVEWWLVDSSEMQGWVPGDAIEPLALQGSQGLEACVKSITGEVYVWSDAQIEQGGIQISDISLKDGERVVVLNPQPRKVEINGDTGSFLKVRSEARPEIEGWVLREGVIYLRQGEECP